MNNLNTRSKEHRTLRLCMQLSIQQQVSAETLDTAVPYPYLSTIRMDLYEMTTLKKIGWSSTIVHVLQLLVLFHSSSADVYEKLRYIFTIANSQARYLSSLSGLVDYVFSFSERNVPHQNNKNYF